MFIFDFVIGTVMDEIMDWIFGKVTGFFVSFFAGIGNMGIELFELTWIQSIVMFFSYFAWALFVVGIVVAVFETAIEYSSGKGSIKQVSLDIIKGFMAVSLFTTLPVKLYALSIELQQSLTSEITGYKDGVGVIASNVMNNFSSGDYTSLYSSWSNSFANPLFTLFIIIMIGYAVIKVFFANLKRGGILLIQIAVGSLYMFSIPRGYPDGFNMWCKQVIAICLTSFLQVTILAAGLIALSDNVLLGTGLMLSANEVPRICGAFGMDTSHKANLMGAVHATQMAVSMTKQVTQIIAK